MTIHLIRMAAGIDSIAALRERQEARLRAARGRGSRKKLHTYTRNIPKRTDELLEGGSIYWVIKRHVRVRQRILAFERETDEQGRGYCLIQIAPELVLVEPRMHKAFQGWRYLRGEDSPPDLPPGAEADDLPPEMAEELRALGLL